MLDSMMLQLPLIGRFAVLFGALLLLPRLAERFGLPGVLGLIAGGIILGPALLNVVNEHQQVIVLFAELGKLLLMFYAGREIDLRSMRVVGKHAAGYGIMTCAVPLGAGFLVGKAFGYSTNASVLIGSLLASHTLLGLPIVKQFKLAASRPVIVTVAATILTDIVSMLVLAVCVSVHKSGFSPQHLGRTLLELAIYAPLVIFGLSWLVRKLFAHGKLSHDGKFAAMLLMVAVAAFGAELIELEGIVGAFLTGIAVRRAIPEAEFEEPLHAIGQALFIPVFFLSVGLLVDTKVLWNTIRADGALVLAIVGALLVAKAVAASGFGILAGFKRPERGLMWSLSIPQVAATLAAALVGFDTKNAAGERLINERILNTMVVLVVVSSVVGPIATRFFSKRVTPDAPPDDAPRSATEPEPATAR